MKIERNDKKPERNQPAPFVVFCETNLRYEGGRKAAIFLGPYLLGCVILELVANSEPFTTRWGAWPWGIFLAYLVLFPPFWKRVLGCFSKGPL